ncbi:MAG: GtrA family protein [Clostridia bacterium]|nr:GtrA family protein [Clostridia bacterium]
MIDKIRRLLSDGEAIRYIIIGICTTLVNYLCFAILADLIKLDVTVSNVTSVIISILFAYVTNKLFVFRSHCENLKQLIFEFVKFVGARGITMVVEIGGLYLLHNLLFMDKHIAKISVQVIVIVGNYFISKLIVFKGKK